MAQTSQETIKSLKKINTFIIFQYFQHLRLGCPLAGSLARSALESIFSGERLVFLSSKLFGCFPGVPRHQESTTDVPRQEFDAPYNLEPRRGNCARQVLDPWVESENSQILTTSDGFVQNVIFFLEFSYVQTSKKSSRSFSIV